MIQHFTVAGMSCEHCIRAVTQAVHEVDGAAEVQVHLPTRHVTVHSGAKAAFLAAAITAAGYEVETTAPAARTIPLP